MANTTYSYHEVQAFKDTVHQLAGTRNRSLLNEFVTHENQKGVAAWFDQIEPDDNATATALSSITGEREYKETGRATDVYDDLTIEELNDLRSPHMRVTKQRTQILPTEIGIGHTLLRSSEFAEATKPTSRIMHQLMRRYWKTVDAQILNAISGNAIRVNGANNSTTSTGLPTSQELSLDTTSGGTFDADFCADIAHLFDSVYHSGNIVLAISPYMAKLLRKTATESGIHITDKDFVSQNYLETRNFPTIYGMKIIILPELQPTLVAGEPTSGETMYAWDPMGIVKNTFDPLQAHVGQSPDEKFRTKMYLEEYSGCARVDDKLVVKVDITHT